MKVALVQLTTGRDPARSVDVALEQIRLAAATGAQLISTPETTHMMEMDRKLVLSKAYAEENDPGLKAFQMIAKELQVWLHIGSLIIKVADDKLANRSFLIGDDGSIKARYDKLHLFDVDLGSGEIYRESALYRAGKDAIVAETPWGEMGLSICYDLRFPELYRHYGEAGATLIMVPAAFTVPTGKAHWHTLLKARAIETGAYILAAAQTGLHETGRETFGHSLVIDPWGQIIADAGAEAGYITADLSLEKVAETRKKMPSLQHSRPFDMTVLQN
ncbi:carbon-nitrogen hydrolase family protein [Kordiimonas sp. SCSIO 12610]|uniref:carbon-nitrogen hydrolase family protein n=1 Tax=Kordiimonas sp. SCSIO 12610 TaxID=2829597 RepID=UPI002108D830|nr:carbon-nitrogen hydrolase family protein [Kordiimonas sp. SCSIO 12610]UTW55740.1 carbon-nitrogen hydrolase family protein [Kordiimonas sp. SCSIO 12610]